jgi:hypothetical protein
MPRPLSVQISVGDVVNGRVVIDGPVLREYGTQGATRSQVLVRCQCGTERWVNATEAGRRSCLCRTAQDITVHGFARRGRKHPLYWVWANMVQRCRNPKNPEWHNYGQRGIKVCEEWLESSNFLVWAAANGWEPGLQIDRIDNDGDYAPANCRFVTAAENSNNRRSHGKTVARPKGERHSVQSR